MLYLLIKQTDTYIDGYKALCDNPDLDTKRLTLFAEQVLSIRDWYKENINDLYESPPYNGEVSQFIISTKAHKDEIAFSEASPDIYKDKYEKLAGSADRFIFAYHSTVKRLNEQQTANKENVEYLREKLEKSEKSNRDNIRYLLLIMFAAAIGQWVTW